MAALGDDAARGAGLGRPRAAQQCAGAGVRDDRFGTLIRTDPATGSPHVFKTNVGATRARGVEIRLDAPIVTLAASGVAVRAFTATALADARCRTGSMVDGGVNGSNTSIVGNRVESVPEWISRSGLTATGATRGGRSWSATVLSSYTAESYADPLNTETPTANGARGLVPAYTLLDADAGISLPPWLRLGAGVSNALDVSYFTKRPTFYPGPGVWPSDGRTMRLSVELTR